MTTPTSLVPPETSSRDSTIESDWGTTLAPTDAPVVFRHSGWARERLLLRAALETANTSWRSLRRFDLCGSDPWVAVDPNDPTRFRLLANNCHSRWCIPCARQRAALISANLRAQVENRPHRFLTLTLKASLAPLADQLDRLYAAFRKLRTTKLWKRTVRGGACVLEVKAPWHRTGWHPHLHIIFDGKYLPQNAVSAEWWRITGDSFIVDVRYLPNNEHVARYVTKYVAKPYSRTVINRPERLVELITALRSRRLVLTFGSWRGFRLTENTDKTEWNALCPLQVLLERVDNGDDAADLVLSQLLRCEPDALRIAGRDPPQEDDPS